MKKLKQVYILLLILGIVTACKTSHDDPAPVVVAETKKAVFKDVLKSDLHNIDENDFMGRMREAHSYGVLNGYGTAIPTFHIGEKSGNIVYGLVLIPKEYLDFKDIPLTELGNVPLDNIQERIRQSMTWASNNGYGAGIPTFYHSEKDGKTVCGTILMKPDRVVFDDVLFSKLQPTFNETDPASWVRAFVNINQNANYVTAFPTFFSAQKDAGKVYGGIFIKN